MPLATAGCAQNLAAVENGPVMRGCLCGDERGDEPGLRAYLRAGYVQQRLHFPLLARRIIVKLSISQLEIPVDV